MYAVIGAIIDFHAADILDKNQYFIIATEILTYPSVGFCCLLNHAK